MRLQRISLILFAVYIVFIFGGYSQRFPELRWVNHLLLTVVAGGWLLWRVVKNRNLPSTPMNIPVFALLILGFATIPFSESPRLALENMWLPVMYAMMFSVIVNMFHQGRHQFVIELLFFLTVVAIFMGFLQIASVIWGLGIVRGAGQGWIEFIGSGIPLPIQTDMRIFLPFGVSTQTAGFFAPMIIITLAQMMNAKRGNRILWGLLLLTLSVLLILTFSRGGLVSLIVGITAFTGIYLSQTTSIRKLLTIRNIVILGIVGVIGIVGLSSVFSLSSISSRVAGDRIRNDLWRSATEMIQDNPLTGVGTGLYGRSLRTYRNTRDADDRISTAHNIYLNTTAENGLGVLVIVIGSGLLITGLWWRQLQQSIIKSQRWYLLIGMFSALLGYAVHNLFDTLTIFGLVTLGIVMIVYVTVEPAKSILSPKKDYGNRLVASLLLSIVMAYGVWFVAFVDRAHWHFMNSMRSSENQLEQAELALALDPNMNLYVLQIAYLKGVTANNDPTEENLQDAIVAYETALVLEPTWDVGIYNLVALYELNNDIETAVEWVSRGRAITSQFVFDIQWARIHEQANVVPGEQIINGYIRGVTRLGYLPLSSFWSETDLRLQAIGQFMESLPVDRQSRVARVHFPNYIENLLLTVPETAGDWWVLGEQSLTVDNDRDIAIEAFSYAIELDPDRGDYYASRARAIGTSDLESALRDLQIARFLGTVDEYPNIIEAGWVTDGEEREALLLNAIPPYILNQGFDAVVFAGRTAQFVPYDSVRQIGRGEPILQVWYDLAEEFEADGDIDKAIQLYQLLRLHAPEDDRIYQQLNQLE